MKRARVGLKIEIRPKNAAMWYPAKITGYTRDHSFKLEEVDVHVDDGFRVVAGGEFLAVPKCDARRSASESLR